MEQSVAASTFTQLIPLIKMHTQPFTIHNSVRHFHTFRCVGITSSLIIQNLQILLIINAIEKRTKTRKFIKKTLIKIGRHKNTVSNNLYLMLWCDIWEWILYLWNAKNYLQTLETFLEKYLKLFKNKVVVQVINHQSDLLKKKLLIILYSTNHCQW